MEPPDQAGGDVAVRVFGRGGEFLLQWSRLTRQAETAHQERIVEVNDSFNGAA